MTRGNYLWYEESHKDAEDFPKWAGEAARQLEVVPRGEETAYGYSSKLNDWLTEFGLRESHGTAVDFGCSSAMYRNLFKDMDYIGIDQNPQALQIASRRWQGRESETGGRKTVFYEAPLSNVVGTFPELTEVGDIGLSITVLQHNHIRPGKEVLKGMSKVLKPGAPLMLMEATYDVRYYNDDALMRRENFPPIDPEQLDSPFGMTVFTAKGWVNFLNSHGFENTVYDGTSYYLTFRRKD